MSGKPAPQHPLPTQIVIWSIAIAFAVVVISGAIWVARAVVEGA